MKRTQMHVVTFTRQKAGMYMACRHIKEGCLRASHGEKKMKHAAAHVPRNQDGIRWTITRKQQITNRTDSRASASRKQTAVAVERQGVFPLRDYIELLRNFST
jgi:hypothetical protein